MFKGYRYNTEKEAQKDIDLINQSLGITIKENEINSYTSYFDNNGYFYISVDSRIESILGEAKEYELIYNEEEE